MDLDYQALGAKIGLKTNFNRVYSFAIEGTLCAMTLGDPTTGILLPPRFQIFENDEKECFVQILTPIINESIYPNAPKTFVQKMNQNMKKIVKLITGLEPDIEIM